MSRIDVKLALMDLDRRTPAYLVMEIPAHGDLKVSLQAAAALKVGLFPTGAVAKLRGMLT